MIESPKNFIEQFQNFIEHIAGVMKGFVRSINNVKPDANGNVALTIGTVQSVNGVAPNSAGNVTVNVGVKTVNSQGPDSNGNVVVQAGVTSVNGKTGAVTIPTNFLPLTGGTCTGRIYAPSFQISSDKRLKENIEPIENALNKVHKITGCTFNFKGSNTRSAGVIAQELEIILPEAVFLNDTGYYSVDYNQIIGLLVNAINELDCKVNKLNGS